jgi:hypothetical protein
MARFVALALAALALTACTDVQIVEAPDVPAPEETYAPLPDLHPAPVSARHYDLDGLLAHAAYRVDLGIGMPHMDAWGHLVLDVWAGDDAPVGVLQTTFTLPEFTEAQGELWLRPLGAPEDVGDEYIAFYVGDRAIYAGGDMGADVNLDAFVWRFSESFAEPQTALSIEVASDSEGEAWVLLGADVWAR